MKAIVTKVTKATFVLGDKLIIFPHRLVFLSGDYAGC